MDNQLCDIFKTNTTQKFYGKPQKKLKDIVKFNSNFNSVKRYST